MFGKRRCIKMSRLAIILTLLYVLNCFQYLSALELPNYIKRCNVGDPEKFNECFIKHGNEAIPFLVKGIKSFRVPRLDPAQIIEVNFNPSPQLSIHATNIEVLGLKNARVVYGSIDMDNNKLSMKIFVPNVTIVGDYEASGRILVLPLEGNGKLRMEIINITYDCTLELDNMQFDSTKKMVLKDTQISFVEEGLILNFENLFNGNKLLSDETNKVLNENWRAVDADLGPLFAKTIEELFKSIIVNSLEKLYFRDVFLP